jgi:hypothetical protein
MDQTRYTPTHYTGTFHEGRCIASNVTPGAFEAAAPAKTAAQDAIETADGYLSNAVLPTSSAATVELHTGNGSLSQPAEWPRTGAGDIDHEAVSKMARALLIRHARTMAGDFRG